MISKIYKIMCVAGTAFAVSSCLDTVILPDDITVGEDFWKTKDEVAMMVNSAYEGMTSENVIERLIVWGDARSDELVQGHNEGTVPTALKELMSANMQVTNRYATWADFYSVINRCNIVLEKAAGVMAEDPNYTQGDYLADRSQMLALRSLVYFYLVRNFRDVPYVGAAYLSSSQSREFVQASPLDVLQLCINDLEEASVNAIQARSYSSSDWRRVGWFTKDGINALLADIYLWRASVLHSDADYQKAVDYCDLVIASKQAQHSKRPGEAEQDYPLYSRAMQAYHDIFAEQNAEESIFEIQVNANHALCKLFYKYGANNSSLGFLKAAPIFTMADGTLKTRSNENQQWVYGQNDIRYASYIYAAAGADVASYDIRKMISTEDKSNLTQSSRESGYTYSGLDRNYIVYRLPDIMLMKAEAQVQLVDTSMAGLSDAEKTAKQAEIDLKLRQAFNLVQAVNTRSLLTANEADSLQWGTLGTMRRTGKDGLEKLVLEERLRELCFEGKRWYDLLRYNYRHVNGVNYTVSLGAQGLEALVPNSDEMLNLVTRMKDNADGLKAKMRNEAYLYLPIPNSDIVLSPQLRQNPAYSSSNQFERN